MLSETEKQTRVGYPLKIVASLLALRPSGAFGLHHSVPRFHGRVANMVGVNTAARLLTPQARGLGLPHTFNGVSQMSRPRMGIDDGHKTPVKNILGHLRRRPHARIARNESVVVPDPASPAGDQPSFKIRALAPPDILPVSRLLLEAFAPPRGYSFMRRALLRARSAQGLRKRRDSNVFFVATIAGKVVGFLEVYSPDYLARKARLVNSEQMHSLPKPYMTSLAVSGCSQRQGIGDALVQAAEGEARKRKWPSLTLKVDESNHAALALYIARGFTVFRRFAEEHDFTGDGLLGRKPHVMRLWLEKSL